METSKKLLIFAIVMVIIVTIATIVAVFVTGDVTPLEFLIGGIFGLCSVAYSFYYWKSKCENLSKYNQGDKIDPNM